MHRIDESMRMCIIVADLREKGFDTLFSAWENDDNNAHGNGMFFPQPCVYCLNERGII